MHPFHLAFPVDNLESARHFYGGLLGCPEGRSSDEWIDFNLFGHQIVAHLAHGEASNDVHSDVDGKKVPVRHFGIVLSMPEWEAMADKLKKAGVEFVIEPYIRFKGEVGEQGTMFFLDPSGNAIEFKACQISNCYNFSFSRGVAQPGSVHAWGACGRRFKSSRPDHRSSSFAFLRAYS
jgi:uncharacterized protein